MRSEVVLSQQLCYYHDAVSQFQHTTALDSAGLSRPSAPDSMTFLSHVATQSSCSVAPAQ
jgi:hypothetical protein